MRTKLTPIALLISIGLATAVSAAPAPPPILAPSPGSTPSKESLDWAFVFASSLHADRKDMGKAQQAAALAYAESGDLALAAERAALIEGWRRGAAFADIAGKAATAGEASTARMLIGKAEAVAKDVDGWETKRIAAHVAEAAARLGDVETSSRLAGDLAVNDPRQYTGRATASIAIGKAAAGAFDEAMAALATLDEAVDFDIAWWRTLGYLEVARGSGVDRSQRLQALDKASASADGVHGWKSAEGKLEVAGAYFDTGQRKAAAAATDAAETKILALGDHTPVKPAFLGRVAVLRHRFGQADQARALLTAGMALVPSQLIIDIPGIYAGLATSYSRVGAPGEAADVFDLALASAVELRNARPRALAMTSICVELGRSETVLDAATRAELRQIYRGLNDPW